MSSAGSLATAGSPSTSTEATVPLEDELSAHARVRIGTSARGRPMWAYWRGDPDALRRMVVVGCIHGDEPAGIPVARRLVRMLVPAEAALVIVPDINPDGVAARSRTNANGVDLNRNFPYRWRPIGHRGTLHYSGPGALSEPESRAAAVLIAHVEPTLSIWFHQALGVVDESGGRRSVEARFARLAGLPLARLPRYPGSATGWENHRMPGSTAFVVELHGGRLTRIAVARLADAVDDLLGPAAAA